MERFLGILIEHYAGAFPTWLAPVQVSILPISDKFNGYAEEVKRKLENMDIKVETDTRSEKIGYKIREAQLQKIPYMFIVGEKEIESDTVSVRERAAGDVGSKTIDEITKEIITKIKNRESDSPGL